MSSPLSCTGMRGATSWLASTLFLFGDGCHHGDEGVEGSNGTMRDATIECEDTDDQMGFGDICI
jgi:hypothetical protein